MGDRERGRPAASAQAAHAQLVWVRGLAAPRIDLNNCAAMQGQGQENQGQNLMSRQACPLVLLPVCQFQWNAAVPRRGPHGPRKVPTRSSQARAERDTTPLLSGGYRRV